LAEAMRITGMRTPGLRGGDHFSNAELSKPPALRRAAADAISRKFQQFLKIDFPKSVDCSLWSHSRPLKTKGN
jgi:hypothetical protein